MSGNSEPQEITPNTTETTTDPISPVQSPINVNLEAQNHEQESKSSGRGKSSIIIATIVGISLFIFYAVSWNSNRPTTEQRYMERISLPEYMTMRRSIITGPSRHVSDNFFKKTQYKDDVVEVHYNYASPSLAEKDLITALQSAGYKQTSRKNTESSPEIKKWTLNYIGTGNQTCNDLNVYHIYFLERERGNFSLECILH